MAIMKNIKEMMPTGENSKTELSAPRLAITSSEQIVTPMNLITLDENGIFMWPNSIYIEFSRPNTFAIRAILGLSNGFVKRIYEGVNPSPSFRQRLHRPGDRLVPNPKLKFMDQCREVMRFHRLALRSEEAYLQWIKRFIFFHGKRHPREMGAAEIRAFLNDLAARQNVAVSTQNQALNALVFLYREVLHLDPGNFGDIELPARPARLPLVLTAEEVKRLLAAMTGTHQLMAQLL